MRYLIAFFLFWSGSAIAQPACLPSAPSAIACQSPAVNPQLTDMVLGQQSNGPLRTNQTVKISLQQILTTYLNTANTWLLPQTLTSPILISVALGTPISGVMTNVTGLPLTTGVTGILGSANGGTGITGGTSGGIPYFSGASTWASSAALVANSLVIGGGAGVAPATTTTGTGVLTALGVNTGTAGAFVVNGGAIGTPSSGTLTNATGLPISTGVSGLGTGVATALGVSTGSAGAFVVNGGALGTPSSGTLTSATGLPISTGISGLGTGVATGLASNATGSGGPVLATSPTITTPGIVGVTNGGNATAGNVGEYISSTVLVGSAVALTTAAATNVTNVSLTAGDWMCEGNVTTNPAGTTTTSLMIAWISSNSAVLPTAPNGGSYTAALSGATAGVSQSLSAGTIRISVSTTTTVFLETWDSFAVSTMSAYGFIGCRRMR